MAFSEVTLCQYIGKILSDEILNTVTECSYLNYVVLDKSDYLVTF